MSLQRLWSRGAIYLVLLAFCVFYLLPFYLMLITGLKPYALCGWAFSPGIPITLTPQQSHKLLS